MQATSACDDCVVTHLLRHDDAEPEPVVLDLDEARVVRLLGRAGLVPDLRFHTAS